MRSNERWNQDPEQEIQKVLFQKISQFKPVHVPKGNRGGKVLFCFYLLLVVIYFSLIGITTDFFILWLENADSMFHVPLIEAFHEVLTSFKAEFEDQRLLFEVLGGMVISLLLGLIPCIVLISHGMEFVKLSGFLRANTKDRNERKKIRKLFWGAFKWFGYGVVNVVAWGLAVFVILAAVQDRNSALCVRGAFFLALCPITVLWYNAKNLVDFRYALYHNKMKDVYENAVKTKEQNQVTSILRSLEEIDEMRGLDGIPIDDMTPVPEVEPYDNPKSKIIPKGQKREITPPPSQTPSKCRKTAEESGTGGVDNRLDSKDEAEVGRIIDV